MNNHETAAKNKEQQWTHNEKHWYTTKTRKSNENHKEQHRTTMKHNEHKYNEHKHIKQWTQINDSNATTLKNNTKTMSMKETQWTVNTTTNNNDKQGRQWTNNEQQRNNIVLASSVGHVVVVWKQARCGAHSL